MGDLEICANLAIRKNAANELARRKEGGTLARGGEATPQAVHKNAARR